MLSTHPQRPPWAVLPASLIPVLAPRLAGVSQEMIEVVRREVPVYAAPLEGGYADAIRLEVGAALKRFLADPPFHLRLALFGDRKAEKTGLGKAVAAVGRVITVADVREPVAVRLAIDAARDAGLVPFCITIDETAHDYLPALFGQQGYALVHRPQDLVQRLSLVYTRFLRNAGR